jgi:hypothetical protein
MKKRTMKQKRPVDLDISLGRCDDTLLVCVCVCGIMSPQLTCYKLGLD